LKSTWYQAVVKAKKELGRGPTVVFKYVVFKHNEAYVDEAQKLAQRLEVDNFQVVPFETASNWSLAGYAAESKQTWAGSSTARFWNLSGSPLLRRPS